MSSSRFALFLLVAVMLVLLAATPGETTRSSTAHVRRHFVRGERASPDHPVQLVVALRQRNLAQLERELYAVSDPWSPRYGQHLTHEQVAALVAPPAAVVEQVVRYFRSMDPERAHVEVVRTRDMVGVQLPASSLEKALGVQLYEYRHRWSNRMVVRTEQAWALPADIAEHVELLTGLSELVVYPSEHRLRRRQLHNAALLHAKATSNDNSPVISTVMGGSSHISPALALFCADGTPMSSLSGEGACEVYGIRLQVDQGLNALTKKQLSLDQLQCSVGAHSHQVECTTQLPVMPWQRCNISAQTLYSDGQTSSVYYYPVLYAPTTFSVPQTLSTRYNIPQNLRGSSVRNSQSVASFEDQFFSHDDLYRSFDAFGLPRQTPIVHGENVNAVPGGEAQLDITYIQGVGKGVPSIFWSVSGPGPAKPPGGGAYILTWAYEVLNATDPPLVTSISYGDTESGFRAAFGDDSYIHRFEAEVIKMGSLGLTVASGSGDAGASNVGEAGNDISNTDPTCNLVGRAFYPSCSAHVTGVSSTFLSHSTYPVCGQKLGGEPIHCDQVGEVPVGLSQGTPWTTGGSFSGILSRASYQNEAVENYLKIAAESLPPPSQFNSSNQAYADVSTIGYNLLMSLDNEFIPIGGTSSSGPIFAGMISLLNDARLREGRSPLGFLNPLLYRMAKERPQAFNDVTVGTNKDGDLEAPGSPYPSFCPHGFAARPGYDPATGLGTPNFGEFLDYVMSLP